MNLRIGLFSPRLARFLAAATGYGQCLRCETPWCFVAWHNTPYTDTDGCLPLCEKCWGQLTPEQRLPYYRQLITQWYDRWPPDNPTFNETWQLVSAAVMEGL